MPGWIPTGCASKFSSVKPNETQRPQVALGLVWGSLEMIQLFGFEPVNKFVADFRRS
jgi:hypothetical protein